MAEPGARFDYGINHEVKEVSLILKKDSSMTIEEFRVLDRLACTGKIWTLIHRPVSRTPCISYERRVEYILDPEALTILYIVSTNILATWDTDLTVGFGPNDELHLRDSFFLRPYFGHSF